MSTSFFTLFAIVFEVLASLFRRRRAYTTPQAAMPQRKRTVVLYVSSPYKTRAHTRVTPAMGTRHEWMTAKTVWRFPYHLLIRKGPDLVLLPIRDIEEWSYVTQGTEGVELQEMYRSTDRLVRRPELAIKKQEPRRREAASSIELLQDSYKSLVETGVL